MVLSSRSSLGIAISFIWFSDLGPTGQNNFPLKNSDCKTYRRKGQQREDDGGPKGKERTEDQQARQLAKENRHDWDDRNSRDLLRCSWIVNSR